ncbi:MAG: hypothetical protein J0H40_05695 [Rhizobiales bacterium]|nr:hypothetical protein [Hyphomicrobiales bacterium]
MILGRRQLIAGAAAAAAVASLPAAVVNAVDAAAIQHADRVNDLMRQLVRLLHSDGYALMKFGDGGRILFWLDKAGDFSSTVMMSADDTATPDVATTLERAVAIAPTLVRL